MKRYILYILLFNFILLSCDSSLDVDADYKNIPVVYSLLDKNDTLHQYVKLNKAFLGDASVSDMAQVSDSLNYSNAIVNIIKYKGNSGGITYSFHKVDTIEKDEGFFANDDNIIYVYDGKILEDGESASDCKFVLDININGVGEVSSETNIVSDVMVHSPLGTTIPREIYVYGTDYLAPQYSFSSGKNAIYFEYFIEVEYYEKVDGVYTLKTVRHSEGTKRGNTLSGNQKFPFVLEGETFYRFLAEELDEPESNRIFYSVRYKFLSAGEDLTMYIDLTKPTYGIVQEKPSFTNIENGWGLFSSRTSTYSPRKKLDLSSLNHLSLGDEVKQLKFENYTNTGNFYSNHRDLDIYELYITK